MEIPDIGTGNIQVRQLNIPTIPTWIGDVPQSIPTTAPVTISIGSPIVNLPGCVESHPDAGKNKKLSENDPRGVKIYCDGTVPSFNSMNYEPNQMVFGKPSGFDTKQNNEDENPDEILKAPEVKVPNISPPSPSLPPNNKLESDCPTPAQLAAEPVGTYLEGFRKKVSEYRLIGDQCIKITEKVPIPEQIIAGLPSAGSVVTTGGIAVVATASALMAKPLADVLLKVIKPTVKKVMKKIAKIRGKEEVFLSVRERRDLQRERTEAIRALKSALKPKG